MSRERRPTEYIQALVRQSRFRFVLLAQGALILAALVFVWGWLGTSQPLVAWIITGLLVMLELILLIAFLRQPVETSESGLKPLSDTPSEFSVADPAGGVLALDRQRHELVARERNVRVPVHEIRALMLELGRESRLMAALQRDLVVLSEMRDCSPTEREAYRTVGALLARAAAVPFEEG